jgi:hypothetical protein
MRGRDFVNELVVFIMEKQELYLVHFRFSSQPAETGNRLIVWRETNGYNVVVSLNSNGSGICGMETLTDAERMASDNQLVITKIELIEDELTPV